MKFGASDFVSGVTKKVFVKHLSAKFVKILWKIIRLLKVF